MVFVEFLGFAAAFCTTISVLPQTIKTWRTKSARDISLLYFSILTIGVVLWFFYGLFITSWPLVFANFFTFLLVFSVLVMKVRYG